MKTIKSNLGLSLVFGFEFRYYLIVLGNLVSILHFFSNPTLCESTSICYPRLDLYEPQQADSFVYVPYHVHI